MGNIFEAVINLLKDKTIPITKRMGAIISIIVLLIIVNDCYGFLYYYESKKKVEILNIIEDTKIKSSNDSDLYEYLDDMENHIINRQSKFEVFFDKIVGIDFTKIKINNNNNQNTFIRLLTSAGILLFLALVVLIIVIIYPFRNEKEKWSVFAGGLLLLIILSAAIWFIQFLWSLLPTLGNIWVNYFLQFLMQILFIYWITKLNNKNG